MRSLARLAFISLSFAPSLALAQAGGADMDYAAVAKAPVGAWAEYTMSANDPKMAEAMKSMKTKYALIEKTAKEMVMEISSNSPMGTMQVQMRYEAAGADGWKVISGKMKMGAQTMDMPAEQIKKTGVLKKGGAVGKLIGNEKVKTPAGTFDCRHYQKSVPDQTGQEMVIDMWMSEKVLPAGMVKSVAKSKGIEILLAGMGTGATSSMK